METMYQILMFGREDTTGLACKMRKVRRLLKIQIQVDAWESLVLGGTISV